MDDYEAYDALGLAALVRDREVSPAELLDAAISRIEAHNPALNAVVIRMYDEARAAVAAGLPAGPFHGVPFLLKDLAAQYAGTRTTHGCRLFADFVADHDSEIVARYRRAGLVVVGKSASPEFGLTTTTESRLFGETHNPWDLARTPGGSSGGAAAAVASGMLPAANASDGGGSIRIPASCCGLVGLKPTRARTPAGPDAGEGWSGMSTTHAVTRSVRDSAALLDATAGPDLGAPYWAAPPERAFLDAVGEPPGRLHIGVQTEAFNASETDAICVAAAEDAAALCESLGHTVTRTRLDLDWEPIRKAVLTIVGANVRATLDERAAVLGRGFGRDDVERVTYTMATEAAATSAADYARALRVMHATGRRVARHLQGFDVLLTPTMAIPPVALGVLSLSNPDGREFLDHLDRTTGFTQIFNVAGNPAMSVPLFWNDAGLPIGVQFAGRYGDESTLFRLAAQLEQARPWQAKRPRL